jgi:hypothetical protein
MVLALASLSACAANGSADSFCLVAKPIYFMPDERMSDRTERAIIRHNEVGASLCGWR